MRRGDDWLQGRHYVHTGHGLCEGTTCTKTYKTFSMDNNNLLSTFQTTTPLNQYRLYSIFHENNNMNQWITTIYCKDTKSTKNIKTSMGNNNRKQ